MEPMPTPAPQTGSVVTPAPDPTPQSQKSAAPVPVQAPEDPGFVERALALVSAWFMRIRELWE